MAPGRDVSSGISFRDVDVAVRAVQAEFNCNVHFTTTTPVASGTSVLFWLAVTAEPRWVGKVTIRAVTTVQRRWPHVDHQTWAGLMFFLINQLHADLERVEKVSTQVALFG